MSDRFAQRTRRRLNTASPFYREEATCDAAAHSFLAMGLSVQQVAQGTGLPLEEVEALL